MIFKPDEVTTLKKGSHIYVELTEEDVRVLKRNFCGVYELFEQGNSRSAEYFEDLILFKNKYGSVQRKFALYNLPSQKTDIYTLAENMSLKEILRWFSHYGKLSLIDSTSIDSINIDHYRWISDVGQNVCYFNVAVTSGDFYLNINGNFNKKKVV